MYHKIDVFVVTVQEQQKLFILSQSCGKTTTASSRYPCQCDTICVAVFNVYYCFIMFHIKLDHWWGQWYHLLVIFPVKHKLSGNKVTIWVLACLHLAGKSFVSVRKNEFLVLCSDHPPDGLVHLQGGIPTRKEGSQYNWLQFRVQCSVYGSLSLIDGTEAFRFLHLFWIS
jgi:hypothetical protein